MRWAPGRGRSLSSIRRGTDRSRGGCHPGVRPAECSGRAAGNPHGADRFRIGPRCGSLCASMNARVPAVSPRSLRRATSCTLAAMISDTSRTQPSSTISAKTRTGLSYYLPNAASDAAPGPQGKNMASYKCISQADGYVRLAGLKDDTTNVIKRAPSLCRRKRTPCSRSRRRLLSYERYV
jgi:hypothetical protein